MNGRWRSQGRQIGPLSLTFFGLLSANGVAIAQPASMMTVETRLSGSPIDEKNVPIAVRAETNSDLNARLKTVLENTLRQRGFVISDPANVILEFRTNAENSNTQKSNLQLRGAAGSAGGREGSIQYSIPLGKSKPSPKRVLFQVTTRLTDQNDREIWRGSAKADFATRRDRFTVLSMLVRQIADLVGKGDVSRSTTLPEEE